MPSNETAYPLVVYKYATGQPIPTGAQYLHTCVEIVDRGIQGKGRLVWHYFLVDPRA